MVVQPTAHFEVGGSIRGQPSLVACVLHLGIVSRSEAPNPRSPRQIPKLYSLPYHPSPRHSTLCSTHSPDQTYPRSHPPPPHYLTVGCTGGMGGNYQRS